MIEVTISDAELRKAAGAGADSFLAAVIAAIKHSVGGQLTAANMDLLNSDQITLLAWDVLHEEVMDGGFVQLIHNGYGPFIFKNPLAKVLKMWGMRDLSKMIYAAHSLYAKHYKDIEADCTDDEFMALFEKFPEFDDYDDQFVEQEEMFTDEIARYVDKHLERFVTVTDKSIQE